MTKVEPALTAEEWRDLRADPTSCEGRLIVHDDGDGLEFVVCAIRGGPVVEKEKIDQWDSDGIAAVIALANHALADSDPRKITRGTIAALDWVLWQAGATGDYTHSVEDRLRPIRDALASYLPLEDIAS